MDMGIENCWRVHKSHERTSLSFHFLGSEKSNMSECCDKTVGKVQSWKEGPFHAFFIGVMPFEVNEIGVAAGVKPFGNPVRLCHHYNSY